MPSPVPWQKGHLSARNVCDKNAIARCAVGRIDLNFSYVFKKAIEARAAKNSNLCNTHFLLTHKKTLDRWPKVLQQHIDTTACS